MITRRDHVKDIQDSFKYSDILSVKKLCNGPPTEFGFIIKDNIGTIFFGERSIMDLFIHHKIKGNEIYFGFKPRDKQPKINMEWFDGKKQYDSWSDMVLDGWVID